VNVFNLNINKFASFLFFLFISLNHFTNLNANLNQEILDNYASSYGNKTANLHILNLFLQENLEKIKTEVGCCDYNITIPDFIGISDSQIKKFLKEQCNIDINEVWNEILQNTVFDNSAPRAEMFVQIFRTKTLPKEFLNALKSLSREIKKKFSENIFNFESNALNFINNFKNFNNQNPENKKYLIIRSTGREDSENMSNAGGNKSIPYITPSEQNISNVIGDVVASYFSKKSLQQRLMSVQNIEQVEAIFAMPFIPVLIQLMIGEKNKGEQNFQNIPVCGVMFTTESSSYMPLLTNIQATYGNNEAIVSNKYHIKFDNFYVNELGLIRKTLYKKTERLAPVNCMLEKIQNPENLVNSQTLEDETLRLFYVLAKNIEQYYGKTKDVEFIYLPKTKTIYLVQLRSIVNNNKDMQPCYVANPDYCLSAEKFKFDVITADASVKKINCDQEIIKSDNIDDALKIYRNLDFNDRNNIKCILIENIGSNISHAATIFREREIPVILVDKFFIKTMNFSDGKELLIDIQRNTIFKISNESIYKNQSLQNLIEKNLVCVGFIEHPINTSISLSNDFCEQDLLQSTQDIQDNFPENNNFEDLINIIKNGKIQDSQNALNSIIAKVNSKIIEFKNQLQAAGEQDDYKKKLQQHVIDQLSIVLYNITFFGNQIITCLQSETNNLIKLYLIDFLKKCLFQDLDKNLVNCFSFNSILNKYNKKINIMVNRLSPVLSSTDTSPRLLTDNFFVKLEFKGVKYALNNEVKVAWIYFLDWFAKSDDVELIKNFENYLEKYIYSKETFSLWLNLKFYVTFNLFNDCNFDQKCLRCFNLLKQSDHDFCAIKDFLFKQQEVIQKLDSEFFLKKSEHIEDILEKFDREIFKFFTIQECQNLLDTAFAKEDIFLAFNILTNLRNFLDKFDLLIKTIKIKYSGSTRLILFKNFLIRFFNFLEILFKNCVLKYNLFSNQDLNPVEILDQIKNRLENLDVLNSDDSQTLPSVNFNVSQSVLFYSIPSRFKDPVTLEDIFTFIHQNANASLSCLFAYFMHIDQNSILNKILSKFKNLIFDKIKFLNRCLFDFKERLILNGIEFKQNKIYCTYSLPSDMHSNIFHIEYDTQTENIKLKLEFLCSDAQEKRWESIWGITKLFPVVVPNFDINSCEAFLDKNANKLTCSFIFNITNQNNVENVNKMLGILFDTAYSYSLVKCIVPRYLFRRFNFNLKEKNTELRNFFVQDENFLGWLNYLYE